MPNDPGICYNSELGLTDPVEFFTDVAAKKYYKYKLRYLIARYGYSNEIAVIELYSEINHAGAIHNMALVQIGTDTSGNPIFGCKDQGGDYPLSGTPYEHEPNFPYYVFDWHNEMAQYIKEELNHSNHPIAVSYGGKPDPVDILNPIPSDLSYYSDFVDIKTYNAYQPLVSKYANAYQDIMVGPSDKPFMFSEFGPGGGHEQCDNGVNFIKTLLLTPFCGAAGAAMNWDWQYPGQEGLWHYMQPVNDLMSGIKLDEENWQPMTPIVSNNNAVEILYLRNFIPDNYRAVGAVSNRTYNYYTQATDSSCNNLSVFQDVNGFDYHNVTAYISTVASQVLSIPDMGDEIEYKINWYNAMNGSFIETVNETSTTTGFLPIHFPFLSGNASMPILFFEIYHANQASFKIALQDTSQMNDKVVVPMNNKDSTHLITILTDWNSCIDSIGTDFSGENSFHVFPNPTNSHINILCNSDESLGAEWQLRDANGKIMESGYIGSPNFSINLDAYANGLYYFYIFTKTQTYVNQVVKQ